MSKFVNSKPAKTQGQQDLAIIAVSSRVYSGPLPAANEMVQYEKICAGAADRIIIMAEKQSEHGQKIEYAVVLVQIAGAF